MKNLIKLFVVVVALVIATDSFAQIFGVKAGLNLSNMLMKDDEDTWSDDFKLKPGFHAGVTAEFPLTELISFETGLLLSTKGYKETGEETFFEETFEYEDNMNLLYVDIPLTAKAYYDIGSTKVYGILGPYVGVGLSGKYKWEEKNGTTDSDEEDIKFGSDEDEDDFKLLDYGLMAGAGVAINSLEVGLTYSLGLANIAIHTQDGRKISNRVLGLTIGYKFNRE